MRAVLLLLAAWHAAQRLGRPEWRKPVADGIAGVHDHLLGLCDRCVAKSKFQVSRHAAASIGSVKHPQPPHSA